MSKAEGIRELKDPCRMTLSGCRVMIAQGVAALYHVTALLEAVRESSNFTDDNDPFDEHDFGSCIFVGN
jgi:hypothetical protein